MQSNIHEQLGPIVVADYQEQRIPRYKGNELIEALPRSKGDLAIMESLTLTPEFTPDQREWETHERFHQLVSLANFMVPMECHIRLARVLDSMMREGYVGRRPMSKEHVAIFHEIYRRQMAGESFRQQASTITPQLSTALIGLSGMGKTTTVKRFLAQIPQVIHHPELNLYQVPWLHIEMSSDGKSIKGLAAAILQKLDGLIPDANYYRDYFCNGRTGADALMRSVARVMNMHCVGLLVIDEVQNMGNSPKGQQVLMTELVGACNELQVPILFIGTNKAHKVLGADFRQARRSLGFGIGNWNALSRLDEDGQPGEWVELISVLWEFQWTRNPVRLTEEMLDLFYSCTQGVIDLAIKLFVASQARAMVDGSETLTEELVSDVFNTDMKLVHPMVNALWRNDMKALAKFEDIAPVELEDIVEDMARRYRGKRTFAASVRPGDEDFVSRLATAGICLGMDPTDASKVATEVEKEGKAKSMLDAVKQLAAKVTPPKRVKVAAGEDATPPATFDDRPMDYRNAMSKAASERTTVFAKLHELGMAKPVDELVLLD